MMGKSWGGFNALQVGGAAPAGAEGDHHRLLDRRPLRRRHPLHGRRAAQRQSLVGRDHARLSGAPARPGARAARAGASMAGSGSKRMPFWPALWLTHQRRDAYWRHGSVCEDFSAIAVPGLRRRRLGRRLHQRRAAPSAKASKCPRLGSSAPGRMSIRRTACRDPRSASCRRRCAGGTIG